MDCIISQFLGSFIAGFVLLVIVVVAFCIIFRDRKKQTEPAKEQTDPEKKRMRTMDIVLAIDFAVLIVFTIVMIVIFVNTGSEPSTLITCVFAAGGGEFGVLGWIKTSKEKHADRKYEEKREEEKADEHYKQH